MLLSAVVPAVAAAVVPDGGTRFRGRVAQTIIRCPHCYAVSLRVTPDRARLELRTQLIYKCRTNRQHRGYREYGSRVTFKGEDALAIKRGGAFHHKSAFYNNRSGILPGPTDGTYRISGSFSKNGRSLHGSLASTLKAKGIKCAVKGTFRARRR